MGANEGDQGLHPDGDMMLQFLACYKRAQLVELQRTRGMPMGSSGAITGEHAATSATADITTNHWQPQARDEWKSEHSSSSWDNWEPRAEWRTEEQGQEAQPQGSGRRSNASGARGTPAVVSTPQVLRTPWKLRHASAAGRTLGPGDARAT